jgi:hypothetical protein
MGIPALFQPSSDEVEDAVPDVENAEEEYVDETPEFELAWVGADQDDGWPCPLA